MLDYKLLEALARVVQEGGFEKAAHVLHLTQSAVSQRIRLLEDQTGQILLARTSPPQATPAGQRMIKHYLQVKQLEEEVSDVFAAREGFISLAVGINDDSLSNWFVEAVRPFLEQERVLLELRPDDQEQTHRLLRDGEVVGCISSRDQPMQGCRVEYMGTMVYRLLTTPEFADRWFPHGLTLTAARRAPAVIYNRKDDLHNKVLQQALGIAPADIPAHYVPSAEKFADFILLGFGYGMLPDQQSTPLLNAGKLVELISSCKIPVKLYWHCWNLKSRILEKFTRNLITRAHELLEESPESP